MTTTLGPITTSALDMRASLPDGGGLIGLDLGTQTIGTAFADAAWRIASYSNKGLNPRRSARLSSSAI